MLNHYFFIPLVLALRISYSIQLQKKKVYVNGWNNSRNISRQLLGIILWSTRIFFLTQGKKKINYFMLKKSLQKTEIPLQNIRNQDTKRLYFSQDWVYSDHWLFLSWLFYCLLMFELASVRRKGQEGHSLAYSFLSDLIVKLSHLINQKTTLVS